MLKRIIFILVLAMAMPMAKPILANPITDSAVSQLRNQGYSDIQVQRTLLGRIRITAISKTNSRELIIHPITGEIMRDRWTLNAKSASSPAPIAINPEGNDGNDGDGDGGDGGDGDGGDGGDGDGGDGGDGDGGNGGGDGDGGDGEGGDGEHD